MKTQRNSRQRQLVLDAVNARADHPTADQIYLDVRAQNDKISRGTVYRNLGVLEDTGEITHVKLPTADRYDYRRDHHYHLFCTDCRKVFDAPLAYREDIDTRVEEETGFRVQRHLVVFEGLCPECSRKKENGGD